MVFSRLLERHFALVPLGFLCLTAYLQARGENSLLGVLGLENGDRIDSINGFTLGTPEQALSAYAHLRQASRLTVSVERHGKPATLSYHID